MWLLKLGLIVSAFIAGDSRRQRRLYGTEHEEGNHSVPAMAALTDKVIRGKLLLGAIPIDAMSGHVVPLKTLIGTSIAEAVSLSSGVSVPSDHVFMSVSRARYPDELVAESEKGTAFIRVLYTIELAPSMVKEEPRITESANSLTTRLFATTFSDIVSANEELTWAMGAADVFVHEAEAHVIQSQVPAQISRKSHPGRRQLGNQLEDCPESHVETTTSYDYNPCFDPYSLMNGSKICVHGFGYVENPRTGTNSTNDVCNPLVGNLDSIEVKSAPGAYTYAHWTVVESLDKMNAPEGAKIEFNLEMCNGNALLLVKPQLLWDGIHMFQLFETEPGTSGDRTKTWPFPDESTGLRKQGPDDFVFHLENKAAKAKNPLSSLLYPGRSFENMKYGYRGDGNMKQRTAFKALNGGYLVSVLNIADDWVEEEYEPDDGRRLDENNQTVWGPSSAEFKLWVQVSAQGEDVVVGRNYSNAALELEIPEDHPSMTQTSCSELQNSMDCAAACCKWTWGENATNTTATERRRLAKAKSKGNIGAQEEELAVAIIEDGTCAPTSFGESVCAVDMIESTGAKLRIFWKELDSPNHLYFLYYAEVDDCTAELDKYGEAPLNAEGCVTTTQQRGRCGSDVPDQECIMETACGIRRNGCFIPMDGDASTLDHCTDEESLKNLDLYSDVYDGVVMGGNDNIKIVEGERRLSIAAFQHDGTADEEIAARWFYMDVPVKNNMSYYFNIIHQEALPEDTKCKNCPKVWEGSYAGTHAVAEYNRPLQMHSDQTILQLFGFIGIATLLLLIPFFALKFFIKSRLLKVFESSKLPSILKLKAKAAYMNLLSGVNKAKNKFKNLKKKKQIHPGGGGLASLAAAAGKKKRVGGLASLAQATAVQSKKKISMGATKTGPPKTSKQDGNGTTTDEDNRVEAF